MEITIFRNFIEYLAKKIENDAMTIPQAFLKIASTSESLANKHRFRKLLSLYNLIARVLNSERINANSEM